MQTSLDGHGDLLFVGVTPELLAGLASAAAAIAAAGCVPAPPAVDLPPTSPPVQAAPVAAFGFRPGGGGGGGSAGSAPVSASSTGTTSPPAAASSAAPASPASAVPVPVMEPFRHLLMTPAHEAAVRIAGAHLRRSLLLAEVESKYVQFAGWGGKNATKRRQRHRAKLEEQTREYSGVLGREASNDALLRPAVGGCVAAFAAVNASDRADDIVLERLPVASDAELDAGRYKFAAATMPAVGMAMAAAGAAASTSAALYGGGGGGAGYSPPQQPPAGGGSAPGGSAGSPQYAGGGGGRGGAMPAVPTATTTYRGGGGGIAMGGGGGSGAFGGGQTAPPPMTLYDSQASRAGGGGGGGGGATGAGGGRTHPGSSGYVMTPTGPQLLVDWKAIFSVSRDDGCWRVALQTQPKHFASTSALERQSPPLPPQDGKMPRQRKRAKLMALLERELARGGGGSDATAIMARLARAEAGDDDK